eukprot:12407417-Karenia_brevis.AAC.1
MGRDCHRAQIMVKEVFRGSAGSAWPRGTKVLSVPVVLVRGCHMQPDYRVTVGRSSGAVKKMKKMMNMKRVTSRFLILSPQ